MKDRIKEIRKSLGLNQLEFGAKIGISNTAVSKWEKGDNSVPDSAIKSICREFGVNETWLRTGYGEMRKPMDRQAELARLVKDRLMDRPESFQSALITTLLRFESDGPEMAALRKILDGLIAEMKKDPEP